MKDSRRKKHARNFNKITTPYLIYFACFSLLCGYFHDPLRFKRFPLTPSFHRVHMTSEPVQTMWTTFLREREPRDLRWWTQSSYNLLKMQLFSNWGHMVIETLKSQCPHVNSPDWSLYIWGNLVNDRSIFSLVIISFNSHNLFFKWCNDIFRRKLMFVTSGTWKVKSFIINRLQCMLLHVHLVTPLFNIHVARFVFFTVVIIWFFSNFTWLLGKFWVLSFKTYLKAYKLFAYEVTFCDIFSLSYIVLSCEDVANTSTYLCALVDESTCHRWS